MKLLVVTLLGAGAAIVAASLLLSHEPPSCRPHGAANLFTNCEPLTRPLRFEDAMP